MLGRARLGGLGLRWGRGLASSAAATIADQGSPLHPDTVSAVQVGRPRGVAPPRRARCGRNAGCRLKQLSHRPLQRLLAEAPIALATALPLRLDQNCCAVVLRQPRTGNKVGGLASLPPAVSLQQVARGGANQTHRCT